MREINNLEVQEKLKQNGLLILDVQTEWCSGCKQVRPTLESLSSEINDVNFYKLDADKNQEYAVSLGIRSIPTIIFYKDGKEVERVIGPKSKPFFKNIIEKHLN